MEDHFKDLDDLADFDQPYTDRELEDLFSRQRREAAMTTKPGEVHPVMQAILDMHGAPSPKPNFHSYDPASSREAAGRMELGLRARSARLVLNVVKEYPDSTAREMAHKVYSVYRKSLDVVEIRRRLSDMEGRQVEKSGQRKCRIAGTKAVTWRAK